MLVIIKSKANEETLKKASEDLDGYIKWVVDVQQEILTAGGLRHFEGEQLLISQGSKQQNLWGGGLELETDEIDFDSMINIRQPINPSRTVLSKELRKKLQEIVRKLIK